MMQKTDTLKNKMSVFVRLLRKSADPLRQKYPA
jgi:hypothetical protein